jgi:NAD(P)-dependent dehydrogenase (short-subunit alcohol dehydrogenase family)
VTGNSAAPRAAADGMFRLDGRRALVTGAATGLGASIAVALARRGADVAITDRPGVSLAATADGVVAHGGRCVAGALDVREVGVMRARFASLADELGGVDILVNNAGINRPAAGLDVVESEWDDHFATNVKGGFFLAQAAAAGMLARGWGRVVFIASQSGMVAIPGQPVYCASKGAVIQLARTLATEWAKGGVTVNAIAPTFVETDLTRRRLQNAEFRAFVLDSIPAGRLATAEQIAAAAVYLASDEAAMVTGATLAVDGGWTAW